MQTNPFKTITPHCCGQQKPNCDKTKQTEAWQTKFIMKKRELLTNNDTRSSFLKEQNQNCSRPHTFTKVTYHGFFKCEGKCYPNTQLEIVLENVIINYIFVNDVYF